MPVLSKRGHAADDGMLLVRCHRHGPSAVGPATDEEADGSRYRHVEYSPLVRMLQHRSGPSLPQPPSIGTVRPNDAAAVPRLDSCNLIDRGIDLPELRLDVLLLRRVLAVEKVPKCPPIDSIQRAVRFGGDCCGSGYGIQHGQLPEHGPLGQRPVRIGQLLPIDGDGHFSVANDVKVVDVVVALLDDGGGLGKFHLVKGQNELVEGVVRQRLEHEVGKEGRLDEGEFVGFLEVDRRDESALGWRCGGG